MVVLEKLENVDRPVFEMGSHPSATFLVAAVDYSMAWSYFGSLGSLASFPSPYLDYSMFSHNICFGRFTYHRFSSGCWFHYNQRVGDLCFLDRVDQVFDLCTFEGCFILTSSLLYAS